MTSPNPNPSPTPEPKPTPEPQPTAPTLTPEQEKEVNGRIAAARRQAEADAKAKFDKDAADRAEADRVDKERKDAEAKGEFDKVRTSIEAERDTFKTEAMTAKERNAKYEEVIGPIIEERLKPFEALNDKDLMADFPKDADALTKLAWLNDPWKQKLIAAQATTNSKYLNHVNTPKPNADGTPQIKSLVSKREAGYG